MGDLVRYPDILEVPIFFQSTTVMLSKMDERLVYDFFPFNKPILDAGDQLFVLTWFLFVSILFLCIYIHKQYLYNLF